MIPMQKRGRELNRAIMRRIERLGRLNDRRVAALAAGNKQALIDIAWEYVSLGRHGGCPRMANEVFAEADGLGNPLEG